MKIIRCSPEGKRLSRWIGLCGNAGARNWADRAANPQGCCSVAAIIGSLQRHDGASITVIVEATGWAAHFARGMISGGLKKKLGFEVATSPEEQCGRIYHIEASI